MAPNTRYWNKARAQERQQAEREAEGKEERRRRRLEIYARRPPEHKFTPFLEYLSWYRSGKRRKNRQKSENSANPA